MTEATLAGAPAAPGVPTPARGGAPEIAPERLDPEALKVLRHLRQTGHQAYLVGGCVRDLLLGRTPKDFDVATSASPEQVRAAFRNCRLIGRRFRLAHVYFSGRKIIEVSTFRKNPVDDLASEPVASPPPEGDLLIEEDNVFGTAEEDARRRDFTVNGLFYDVSTGAVIDYVGGRADLDARAIRTIGNPEVRIREDPVRVLRAVRFAAKLDFTIEPSTAAAIQTHAHDLVRCASPRVLEETLRLLRCGAASRAFRLLREYRIVRLLLPPVAAFLDACGPEESERLFGLLDAADRRVRSGAPAGDSFLLAALLLRLARPSTSSGAPAVPVEPLLSDLVHLGRLPRRIAEGTRLLLLSQRALLGETRRRGSPNRILRSAHFAESLALMEANATVTGEGQEALARWRDRDAGHPPRAARPLAPLPVAAEPAPRSSSLDLAAIARARSRRREAEIARLSGLL